MSTDTATIQEWFDAHVDDEWGTEGIEITADDDDDKEIAIKRIARRF